MVNAEIRSKWTICECADCKTGFHVHWFTFLHQRTEVEEKSMCMEGYYVWRPMSKNKSNAKEMWNVSQIGKGARFHGFLARRSKPDITFWRFCVVFLGYDECDLWFVLLISSRESNVWWRDICWKHINNCVCYIFEAFNIVTVSLELQPNIPPACKGCV